MASHTSRTLVGRDAELEEISSLLGVPSDVARPRSAVLLSGDAGVGKTRLLAELRDRALAADWQVVVGHCLDFGDSALPYLPFSEVLGRLAADLPDVVDTVASLHPALARLQPGRRFIGSDTGSDPQGASLDRADLFQAVHDLFEAAATKAPTLLVVEDCHWADQSTRDMLSFLFSRPFVGPVAVVASYRSDDLHRRHPLRTQVAEWSRLRGVERLQLPPLSPPDVRSLIRELHPDDLSEEDIADIVDRADGNAFFVEELVGAASGPGRWVPEELADLLLVRLDQLDDTGREVVRAASVGGRTVSHEMLAAASGLADSALHDGLRLAVERNVLVAERGAYSFRHALLGEAVYDDLLPGERVRLHAQYAAALADRTARGTAAELARHARLANDLDLALDASVRAGHEAMAVGGAKEAAQHYQQALELLADPRRGQDLDLDLSKLVAAAAESLMLSGDPERGYLVVREQLSRMPAGATDAQCARMITAQANAGYVTELDVDWIALSAEAVRLAPEGDSGLRARVLANHARILAARGRYEEAQTVGVEALALAERLNLQEIGSDVITTLSGLKKAGPREGLRAALLDAVARAQEAGAVHAELRGRFFLARSYEDWAEFEGAEEWFSSAITRAEESGLPWAPYGFESRWQLAWVKEVVGDWDEVLRLTRVDDAQAAPPIPRAMLDTLRLSVEHRRGADVHKQVKQLRKLWEREGGIAIHAAEVEMSEAARRGEPEAALERYDAVVAVLSRIWHEWFAARIRLAAVAIGAVAHCLPQVPAGARPGLMARVEQLHADGHTVLERYTDPSGHWGPEGRAWTRRLDAEALRARWLSGTDAPSQETLVEAWRETEALFADFGHVHELARVRTVLAGILRATGDTTGAREVGDLARAAAHQLGAQPLLDDLRAIGSTAVRAEGTSDSLTPRETEILALVAEGRSNGEIGRQLFISAKTVSVHVSNILGKLDAAGRTEAAAIARRRGLLP